MNLNEFPLFPDSEFGLGPFYSTGSWLEIDLSGTPNSHSSDTGGASPTWESDWIDLGGEG